MYSHYQPIERLSQARFSYIFSPGFGTAPIACSVDGTVYYFVVDDRQTVWAINTMDGSVADSYLYDELGRDRGRSVSFGESWGFNATQQDSEGYLFDHGGLYETCSAVRFPLRSSGHAVSVGSTWRASSRGIVDGSLLERQQEETGSETFCDGCGGFTYRVDPGSRAPLCSEAHEQTHVAWFQKHKPHACREGGVPDGKPKDKFATPDFNDAEYNQNECEAYTVANMCWITAWDTSNHRDGVLKEQMCAVLLRGEIHCKAAGRLTQYEQFYGKDVWYKHRCNER